MKKTSFNEQFRIAVLDDAKDHQLQQKSPVGLIKFPKAEKVLNSCSDIKFDEMLQLRHQKLKEFKSKKIMPIGEIDRKDLEILGETNSLELEITALKQFKKSLRA